MRLQKRNKYKLLILIAFFLGSIFLYQNYLSNQAYIRKITNIKLPFCTVTNQTSSMEVAVIGKYQIPENKIEEFISNNQLRNIKDVSDIKIDFDYILKKENRLENKNGNWFQYKNCKNGNVWKILFNSESRDLWILVLFPDMAGDEPNCDKKIK